MWYGFYPHMGWFSPWGPPMTGPWAYPYGGGWQMPSYAPWGGFGSPGMSPYASPMTGGVGAPGIPPYGPPMAPEQEIEFLRTQAQMLKDQLDQIDGRIKELEKQSR